MATKKQGNTKIKGERVAEVNGIEITVLREPAKTSRGKNRLWIQIRQQKPPRYRVYQSLAYAKAVDLYFEEIDSSTALKAKSSN